MEFELVHEIQNQCPNNQMRDIFFEEIQCDDPEVQRSNAGSNLYRIAIASRNEIFILRTGSK